MSLRNLNRVRAAQGLSTYGGSNAPGTTTSSKGSHSSVETHNPEGTKITNSEGEVTIFNDNGKSVTSPDGNTTTNYDNNGNVISTTTAASTPASTPAPQGSTETTPAAVPPQTTENAFQGFLPHNGFYYGNMPNLEGKLINADGTQYFKDIAPFSTTPASTTTNNTDTGTPVVSNTGSDTGTGANNTWLGNLLRGTGNGIAGFFNWAGNGVDNDWRVATDSAHKVGGELHRGATDAVNWGSNEYNNFLENGHKSGEAYTNWITPKTDAINNAVSVEGISNAIGYGAGLAAYGTGRGLNYTLNSGPVRNFENGLNGEPFEP